jgi:hydroxymethylbilane synthase
VKIVIATRGSQLALWQAEHLKARMLGVSPGLDVEFNVIKTSGDKILDVALAKVGGKGLFVKEIEEALLAGTADVAVHSMKDVPAELAPGLELVATSSREVPWDALCMRPQTSRLRAGIRHGMQSDLTEDEMFEAVGPTSLDTLPHGAKVGTSSMRRQCQLLARRPDLKIALLRGNVPTRVKKLDDGEFDAIVLAAAGLTRLGMANRITQMLPLELSIPAVAQGVLGLEMRKDAAAEVRDLVVRAIHDEPEAKRIAAERAFLLRMGGSCQTPLAAHASDRAGGIHIVAMCGMPDGTKILRGEISGPAEQGAELGTRLADDLLARGAGAILAATK